MQRFARGLRSPSSPSCRHLSLYSFVFVNLCCLFPATFPIASLGCQVKSGQSSERWDRALDFFFRFPGCCDVARPPRHFSMPDVFFSPSVFLSVCSVDGPAAVAPASGGASRSSSTSRTAVKSMCDLRGLVRCRHRRHSRRGGVPTRVSTPASTGVIIKTCLIMSYVYVGLSIDFFVCRVFRTSHLVPLRVEE